MAIAYDASAYGNDGGGLTTSISWSHTCTGSNLILIVGTVSGSNGNVSGVTYNGVAMTKITGSSGYSSQCGNTVFWYLINPPTGSHTVAVTLGSSDTISGVSASYTGASQTSQPDSYHASSNSTGTTYSDSTTTVANNSWVIGYFVNNQGTTISAGSGTTSRVSVSGVAYIIANMLADSNGPQTPAGSATLNATAGASGYWLDSVISISPTASTGYTRTMSDAIMNSAGTPRLATVTRTAGFLRTVSASIMNAASRLATLTRSGTFTRTMGDAVMNSAGWGAMNGLVAWWKLGEGGGSTAFDSSGGGTTGTWNGTPSGTLGYYAPGKIGSWAGAFDGSTNYVVSTKNSVGLGITNQATYAVWANVSNFTNQAYLISDYGTNAVGMTLRIDNATTAEFYVYPNNYRISYTTGTFNLGTWYHIAGVMNGSTMYLYVNGVQVGSTSLGNNIGNSANNLTLGERGDLISGSTFAGLLDDVRVYNRALSSAELLALYTSTSPRLATVGKGLFRTMSDSIMNSVSRFVSVTAIQSLTRRMADSVMNSASRLATVSKMYSTTRTISASIMNSASRLATVTSLRSIHAYLSDSIMNARGRLAITKAYVNGLLIQYLSKYKTQSTTYQDKYEKQNTVFDDKYQ